jgi:ParB family chromosome partitioning protein
MRQSLDELAESSMKMLAGETVVSLDPADLDSSFVSDRIDESDEEYAQLREAIKQSGQSTPILVRPHPDAAGRYMIVFGHRRAKVARELGTLVRAVVKPLADIEHVIAQGQENTARSDLSFIEKALFAQRLLDQGMTRSTIKSALTVDDTLLSRMLSVAGGIPKPVLSAVGAAKGVGRDRWEELKKLVQNPTNAERSVEFVEADEFAKAQDSEQGFNLLLSFLKSTRTPRKARVIPGSKDWAPEDRSLVVAVNPGAGGLSLEFKDKGAKPFGEWLARNLDSLYEAFRKSENR